MGLPCHHFAYCIYIETFIKELDQRALLKELRDLAKESEKEADVCENSFFFFFFVCDFTPFDYFP